MTAILDSHRGEAKDLEADELTLVVKAIAAAVATAADHDSWSAAVHLDWMAKSEEWLASIRTPSRPSGWVGSGKTIAAALAALIRGLQTEAAAAHADAAVVMAAAAGALARLEKGSE